MIDICRAEVLNGQLTVSPLLSFSSGSDHGENLINRYIFTQGHTEHILRIHDGFEMHEFMENGARCINMSDCITRIIV